MNDTSGLLAMISALVSSIALVGVAASLVIQTRQLRTSQLQATRAAQADVVQLSLENPRLFVHGEETAADETDLYTLHAFTNLIFKYLELGFETGVVSELSVRTQAAVLFQSPHRRQWWSAVAGPIYSVEARTRRERKFAGLVDEEFRKLTKEASNTGSTTGAGTGFASSDNTKPAPGSN